MKWTELKKDAVIHEFLKWTAEERKKLEEYVCPICWEKWIDCHCSDNPNLQVREGHHIEAVEKEEQDYEIPKDIKNLRDEPTYDSGILF